MAQPAQSTSPGAMGIWANPKATLQVRTFSCGTNLCGTIIGATAEALADARDAGVTKLVGTELLQDYAQTSPRHWSGRVYVPDMGRTFSSRITQDSPGTLKIAGCLVGGWFCKSQVWHRVG